MTITPDVPAVVGAPVARDRRGSWVPSGAMVSARFMELRKRRGVMAALIGVLVGIPTVFLVIRLVLHAVAPKTYGPAGGYDIYTALVAGILYVFGFIVAATLGCTAGAADLNEGMFRHLVVTGRSRLALYLARIPAGLAIIVPLVAMGYAIVCAVCVFAAPTALTYQGVTVPAGLSRAGLETWAGEHAHTVICDFNGPILDGVTCGNHPLGVPIGKGPNGQIINGGPAADVQPPSAAAMSRTATRMSDQNYADYAKLFLRPPAGLMIKAGLWLELEAVIGFTVGLGLASLLGQRTIAVVMMIVLEVILTPIAARARIPHFQNAQRAIVGLATAHIEPGALPLALGGDRGVDLLHESTAVAVCVIIAWLVGWTLLGAWRMVTRDA